METYFYRDENTIGALATQAIKVPRGKTERSIEASWEFEPKVYGVSLGKLKIAEKGARSSEGETLDEKERVVADMLDPKFGACWNGRPKHDRHGLRFASERTWATCLHVPSVRWLDGKETPSINLWIADPKDSIGVRSLLCLLERPIGESDKSVFFANTSGMHTLVSLIHLLRAYNPRLHLLAQFPHISFQSTPSQYATLGTEHHPQELDELYSVSEKRESEFLKAPIESLVLWGAIVSRERCLIDTTYYLRCVGQEEKILSVFGYPLWIKLAA